MVRVPEYNNKELPNVAPGVRVSTGLPQGSFGSGSGQVNKAANDLFGQATSIYLEEKKKADKAKVNEAYSQLTLWRNQFVADAKTRTGEGAFTLPDELEEQYAAQVNGIKANLLHNDAQISAFDNLAFDTYSTIDGTVKNKVSQEQFTYRKNNSEASLENDVQFGIQNFDSPEYIVAQKERISAHVQDMDWLTPEQKKAKEFDSLSQMHIGVVQNLITQDTDLARDYFESNKNEINQSNLNNFKLDKNILAYQKENARIIEDELTDKEIEGTLTPQDIMSVNKPVEQGGIGSVKAKQMLKRLENAQIADLENIDKPIKEATKYIELVDKLVDDKITSLELKNLVADAYADGELLDSEKREIVQAKKILSNIQNKALANKEGANVWPGTWPRFFAKSVTEIKQMLTNADFSSDVIRDGISELIDFSLSGEKDEETMQAKKKQIMKDKHIKKDPRNSLSLGFQQNAKGAWVYVFEKSDGSLGVRAATLKEIESIKDDR